MPERTLDEIRRKVHGKPFHHAFHITRDAGDPEARTVDLAFASDKPIEHWFGAVRLMMGKKNVRTDRLQNGAPLLMDHNTRDQIGVVDSFSFDSDGMARATVRFSESQRGEEIFKDVKGGIRQLVSVGFMIYELNLESEKKGEPRVYRADDWEPYEISIVSVPADISVGVGRSLREVDGETCPECELPIDDCECADEAARSLNAQTRAISTNGETQMEEENIGSGAAPAVERTAAAVATERSRELIAFGEIFGQGDLARQLVLATPDVTLDDVRTAIRSAQPASTPIPVPSPAAAAERQGAESHVELARTYSRVQLKAFKGERAHERAYRSGMHLAAVLLRDERAIQYCRDQGIALGRAQTGTDNTAGGFTVIPEFSETLFELIIQYGVLRPNADIEQMNSDTKLVTRRKGGLTAYPVGSGQRGTYSGTTDDQFELIARKWMVLAKYEDELGEDSFINWADRLANESGIALAYAEDNAGFNGDGTSAYHGIVGLLPKLLAATAGIVTAAGATYASVTLANMTSVIGKLPQFARKSGNVKWYCSSSVWANVLERIALAANGSAYQDIKGELTPVFAGKPVEIVEVMPAAEATGQLCIAYGNMTQAVTFGDRRGVTVKMSDSNDTDFEADLHAVKVTERFDVNAHDVGDTTVAGPLVGLKLA